MKHKFISLKISSTGQTKDLGGPDLARGLHFAHPCCKELFLNRSVATNFCVAGTYFWVAQTCVTVL